MIEKMWVTEDYSWKVNVSKAQQSYLYPFHFVVRKNICSKTRRYEPTSIYLASGHHKNESIDFPTGEPEQISKTQVHKSQQNFNLILFHE